MLADPDGGDIAQEDGGDDRIDDDADRQLRVVNSRLPGRIIDHAPCASSAAKTVLPAT